MTVTSSTAVVCFYRIIFGKELDTSTDQYQLR